MKVLCTKTGPCNHFAPFTENVPWCKAKGETNCPYYTRTGLAEVIDWRERYEGLSTETHERSFNYLRAVNDMVVYREAFDAALAAFEELAGEHRELLAALNSPRGVVWSAPLAADDKVSVRPYIRAKPRRRLSPNGETAGCGETSPEARSEASPTGDKDIESGESQAKAGGQGEAFKGPWICLNCLATHDREYTYCPGCDGIVAPVLPQSGESSDLIRQGLEDCAEGRVSKYEERSE